MTKCPTCSFEVTKEIEFLKDNKSNPNTIELMKRKLSILLFIVLSITTFAQIEGIQYDDAIYDEGIHAVQFHVTDFPLTQPIIELGEDSSFTVSFDDLNEQIRDIYYTIIHCDMSWQPSDLNNMEYIDGFDEDQLDDSDFSSNTLTEFTHYEFELPNDNMRWTKSGNYILVVYTTDGDKLPLFTRRFMVVDTKSKIDTELMRAANANKVRTHQEIDFVVTPYNLKMREPRNELRAIVLQNGRWDNAVTDIPPYSINRDKVIFDYQDRVSFPAGKEYRFLDLRSFRFRGEGIATIEEYEDVYEVTMIPDIDLSPFSYQYFRDINGSFTLGNIDEQNDPLRTDYGLVLFSVKRDVPFYDKDVYRFGKLTDWQIKEKFKMAYSEKLGLYAVDVLIKQGYYNYTYALVDKKTKEVDTTFFDGNWFEAENDYTILLYHRPFGARYDQLVGRKTFKSLSIN